MPSDPPSELAVLLNGRHPAERGAAWARLLAQYSNLLLKAAGTLGGGYDDRMDRYRHVIEQLEADDYHRLRTYAAVGDSSFASWLLVVARRLSLDFERRRFGRGGRSRPGSASDDARRTRGRLLRLAGVKADPDELAHGQPDPDQGIRHAELLEALRAVLSELDPADRLLLKLRYEDDLPVRDVADVLGVPTVFHVYHRLRPLLRHLRERLNDRGVEGPSP